MNYHDAFGVPGVVTRMFNNYGPRQNPRYVTGTIITQALTRPQVELGALEPLRDFCFCTDGVRGHLTVAAHGVPGDVYVYGQGKNISMADWSELILRVGREHGYWGDDREIVTTPARLRPGVTDVMALRVGYEKLHGETGWEPLVSWEEGVLQTIAWYAENRDRWIGRVDWLTADERSRASVTLLRRGELVENDGILHRADAAGISEYRRRWEDEAAEDHIRSAIAGGSSGPADLAALTGEDLASLGSLPGGAALRERARDRRGLRAHPAVPRQRARRHLVELLRRRHLREHAPRAAPLRRAVRPESRREPVPDLRLGGLPCRSRTTRSISRSRAPSSCTWARASSSGRSRRSRARSSRAATSSSTSRSRTRATRRASTLA